MGAIKTAGLKRDEIEALKLAAEGVPDSEIAARQNYSVWQVRIRWRFIYAKLRAKSRPHAVAVAIRTGIIK